MIRKIECMKCWRSMEHFAPTPAEDAATGWKRRVVTIRARKPATHAVQIISDSVTENREGEPLNWESDYE